MDKLSSRLTYSGFFLGSLECPLFSKADVFTGKKQLYLGSAFGQKQTLSGLLNGRFAQIIAHSHSDSLAQLLHCQSLPDSVSRQRKRDVLDLILIHAYPTS